MPYEPDPELQLQDALWAKRLLKYVVLYWTFALGKWFLFSAALVIGCVILFNTFFRDFLNQPKRLGGLLEVPSFWPILVVLFFAFPFVFLLRWILKYRALLRNVERLFEQYGNLPKENFSEIAEINCSLARRAGVRPVEVVALDSYRITTSVFPFMLRVSNSNKLIRLGISGNSFSLSPGPIKPSGSKRFETLRRFQASVSSVRYQAFGKALPSDTSLNSRS